jgi:hypothetical protein
MFQNQRNCWFWLFFKNLKDPSGFMKELAVFWGWQFDFSQQIVRNNFVKNFSQQFTFLNCSYISKLGLFLGTKVMNYPHIQWVSGAISNTCPTLLLTSCYQHNKNSHVVTQTATAFPEREPVEKMDSQHAAHCSPNHLFHAQLNTTTQTSIGLVCRHVPCMKDPMKLV